MLPKHGKGKEKAREKRNKQGTNAEKAKDILSESGLDIIPANDMKDAARKVVDAATKN